MRTKLIPVFLIFMGLSISTSTFADNSLMLFECEKGGDTLKANFQNSSEGPVMWGLHLKKKGGGHTTLGGYEGYQLFENLLLSSQSCEDMTSRVIVGANNVYICIGEMFAPRGAYGQILLTVGSIEVFKNFIAPASGWTCRGPTEITN